ncbi:MAG: hypothetical protein WC373_05265 [Smithella sp.]|jgi:tRNA A37 threonylcarbamoyladenosine dehydratase
MNITIKHYTAKGEEGGEFATSKIEIPQEIVDRLIPPAEKEQPEIINNLDKLKKFVPDQYDILIDAVKFIAERVNNPNLVVKDKLKINDFFSNIHYMFKKSE